MHNVIHILRGILLKPLNDLYIFPKFDPRSNDRELIHKLHSCHRRRQNAL